MILGLDTTTSTCSTALWDTTRAVVAAEYMLTGEGYIHSEKLLPMIDTVMRDAGVAAKELKGLAVTVGPGSFTGLRIGVTAAKLLSYTWELPLVGVSSLDVLCASIGGSCQYTAALLDARNRRVYAQVLERGGSVVVEPAQYPIERLADIFIDVVQTREITLVGSGARAYAGSFCELLEGELRVATPGSELHRPQPSTLCRLAAERLQQYAPKHTLELVPSYLRASSAEREAGGKGGTVHGGST